MIPHNSIRFPGRKINKLRSYSDIQQKNISGFVRDASESTNRVEELFFFFFFWKEGEGEAESIAGTGQQLLATHFKQLIILFVLFFLIFLYSIFLLYFIYSSCCCNVQFPHAGQTKVSTPSSSSSSSPQKVRLPRPSPSSPHVTKRTSRKKPGDIFEA